MSDAAPRDFDADDIACDAQPALAAAALCAVCLRPYAGRFLGVLEDGRACCNACADREGVALQGPDTPDGADPLLAKGWREAFSLIVVQPYRAFATEYEGTIGEALRAGYVFTVLGYGMRTAWDYVLHRELVITMLAEQLGPDVPESTLMLVPWLAVPLSAALRLALGSVLLHVGIRLTGVGPGTFHAHARLFALTSITLLACAIPMVGPLLALVAWMSSTLAFMRQRYGLPTWRALIASTPALLLVTSMDPALSSLASSGG